MEDLLEHYHRLLNVEFDWDPNHLSDESPVEGPPIPITIIMVKKAISQMKAGKAPGPSGIVVEMIRALGYTGASMICDLAAAIISDGKVPSDWEQSFIVCLYKGKRDALDLGIMICGMGLDSLQSSGELPWAVCRTGMGSNSIFCKGCKHWVHKKCSGLKRLTEDPEQVYKVPVNCMPEGSPSWA